MAILRAVAIMLALSLMVGEGYRSWGAGRPVAAWLDDYIIGALLISAALLVGRETARRRAFFTGAWGVAAGMLYISFFDKVFAPEATDAGNLPLGVLTMLVGIAFAVAICGFAASLAAPFRRDGAA